MKTSGTDIDATNQPASLARAALARRIDDVLRPLVSGHDERIMIIDPPGYSNVGDSAIFLGELDWIKREFPKSQIKFYDFDNYSERADRDIARSSIILLQGGGNFGDLYDHHHSIRLKIIDKFRGIRILQLPQSIHFEKEEPLHEMATAIRKHGDFHFLVRDDVSAAFAAKHFECPVIPCPDMAFALRPMRRLPWASECFCLLRIDKETAQDHDLIKAIANEHFGGSVAAGDWLDDWARHGVRRIDRLLSEVTRHRPRAAPMLMPLMLAVRRRYAEERLQKGIELLSSGRIVISDRLHAHVLCCLLDIEHVFMDSLDRKVSAMHRTWTMGFPGSHFIESPADLRKALHDVRPAPANHPEIS